MAFLPTQSSEASYLLIIFCSISTCNLPKGNYIVFVDSDDYLEYDYFEGIVAAVVDNSVDVIFVDVIQEKPDGNIITLEKMSDFQNLSKTDLIRVQMTGKMPWGATRKVVKKKLIDDFKIMFTNDCVGEEAIYSFYILYYSQKHIFINKGYYHYVNYPESQSKKGGINPWGPVVNVMEKKLAHLNLLTEYKRTINSLAYTTLAISFLRYSKQDKSLINIIRFIKREYCVAHKKYNIKKLDCQALTNKVKIIILLLKYKLYFIIAILCLVKNKLDS